MEILNAGLKKNSKGTKIKIAISDVYKFLHLWSVRYFSFVNKIFPLLQCFYRVNCTSMFTLWSQTSLIRGNVRRKSENKIAQEIKTCFHDYCKYQHNIKGKQIYNNM